METKLAPGFLVASPQLKDSFFSKTVIFLLEHSHEEGTFGIILNKIAKIKLQEVYEELGIPLTEKFSGIALSSVLEGGPVTPELGWVIHSTDWQGEATKPFCQEIGVTASIDVLRDIAKGEGPSQFWFCLGYSGWGPYQLMKEIQSGSWLHVPFCTDLFFDIPRERLWETAISKLGINPVYLSPAIGGA